MACLTPSQLGQAASYLRTSSASKNPVSLVMELGQLLHITPQFDVFEPREISSIHQHVFACNAQFGGYQEKATGYNKKKVKTDAAKQLIDRIKRDAEHVPLQRHAARVVDPTPEQQRGHIWQTNTQSSPPFNVASSGAQTGNAVGELQEYAMGSALGMPDYSFGEEVIGGQWTFTATVRLPTIPDVQTGRSSNKADAKQFAARKMLQTIKPTTRPTQTTAESPSAADKIETVQDRLGVRVLRKYLEQMGLNDDEAEDNSTAPPTNPARDLAEAFRNVDVTALGRMANRGVSAIEKLNKIATLECFKIEFHDIESTNGSHICLLKAELGSNMVCHGIGENQPQARENAAENMIFVIHFFKEERQRRSAKDTN